MLDNYEDVPRSPKELVEFLAVVHLGIATNEDSRFSGGNTVFYRSSEKLFTSAITLAYPELPTDRIHEVWLDCNESIEYCAEFVAKEIADEKERKRLNALEDAAYASAYEMGKTCAALFHKDKIGSRTAPVRVPDYFSEVSDEYVRSYREGWKAYELDILRAGSKGE